MLNVTFIYLFFDREYFGSLVLEKPGLWEGLVAKKGRDCLPEFCI